MTNVELIKGSTRSIIYDIQERKPYFIPNAMFEIIEQLKLWTIEETLAQYKKSDQDYVNEYIDFLSEKNLVYKSKHLIDIKNVNKSISEPYDLQNLITDISNIKDVETLFNKINNITVKCISFILNDINDLFIEHICSSIHYKSNVETFELLVQSKCQLSDEIAAKISDGKLTRILFFNAVKDIRQISSGIHISYFQRKMKGSNFEQAPIKFDRSLNTFIKSHEHNIFYYRKLFIDNKLNIKPSYESEEVMYNITHTNLKKSDLTTHERLNQFWNSKKSNTRICKDCEFRNMCVDSRTPKFDDVHQEFYFQNNCNYNPYSAKWLNTNSELIKR